MSNGNNLAFITSLTTALAGLVTPANLSAAVSSVSGLVNNAAEIRTDLTAIMANYEDADMVKSGCNKILLIAGLTDQEKQAVEAIKAVASDPSKILDAVLRAEQVLSLGA